MALLVGELYALMSLNSTAFLRGLKLTEAAARSSSASIGSSLAAAGKVVAVGLGAAAVGIAAVGAASISAAADFQVGMAKIQTLIGKGSAADARIKELGESVKDMSILTGKSLEDIQRGLYDVIGTFTDTADSAKWLEVAVKAGAAGMSTTHDAILLLGAVTKAYGDTSLEAARKASDLIFETANLGVTTFPEMAASMGKVLPIAAALKVSEEELFGAMAALTGVTGDTALVTTQLRSTMNAFLKPNTLMRKAIEETGFASGQAIVEALGLSGALDLIAGTSVVAERGIAATFGRVESLTAVLALNGAQAEDWRWKTIAMANAAGRTDRAFEIMQATVGATIDRIGAAFGVMAVNIGNELLPGFKALLDGIETAMPAIQEAVVGVAKAITVGIKIAAGVIGWFVDKLAIIWKVMGDLGMQGPIIAAVVTVIAAAFAAWAISAGAAAVATIAATWPVLAVIGLIALGIKGITLLMEHFGITGEDVFKAVGKFAQDFATDLIEIAEFLVNVISIIPGPLQAVAGEWKATLASMKSDVAKWGQDVVSLTTSVGSNVGASVGNWAQQSADALLNDSAIYETYKKAGNKAGRSVIDELLVATQNGISVTEEQLQDLGVSVDDALAAGIEIGEPGVSSAVTNLVEKFGYEIKGVILAAKEAGGQAMVSMAQAITEHRTEALTAMDNLIQLMKTSLHPLKEAGKLAGNLMSKALRRALHDDRPDVVAQAQATMKLTIERLTELAIGGGKAGKKAMDTLKKGMKSKDPVIRAAAEHAMEVIEAQLKKDKEIRDAARRTGDRAADALESGFGHPRLLATVSVQLADDGSGQYRPRMGGGPIDAHKVYRVGENGPEWFISDTAGKILPSGFGADGVPESARRNPGGSSAYGGQFTGAAMGPAIGVLNLTINAGNDVSDSRARRFGQNVNDAIADGLRRQTARMPA